MAVRFDTPADRLSYSAAPPPDTFTLTAWVYLTADSNTWSTIAQLRDAGDATVAELASTWYGTTYWDGAGTLSNSTSFVVGEWRKVAMTRSGSSGEVYAASKTGATDVATGTVGTGTSTQLTLAARGPNDTAQWLNGRLAYVRIWDSVLSQSDIEAEWLSTTPVVTSGLWADWPLTTAADLTDTVNSRTLTVADGGTVTTETGPDPGSANRAFVRVTGITFPASRSTVSLTCTYVVLEPSDVVTGGGRVVTVRGIGWSTSTSAIRAAVASACRADMDDTSLEVRIIGDVGDLV